MYGQKNYLQAQGIPPTKYRIQQIGCFLTSFANLLERFGKGVSPVDLNAIFRDRGIYVDVDDGVRDDLGWQSVTAYNGQIVVSKIANGSPSNNNSIVKFLTKTNNFGTHFCLVHDAAAGLIVDSWDGQIKSWNVYGGPVAYATYVDITPQPVPPPPAPAPAPAPPPEIINVTVQPGWGITYVLKAAGYTKEQWENPAEWSRMSALNGVTNGNMRLQPNQIVKVNRTPLPLAAPAPPAPAPVVPTPAPTPVPTPAPAKVEEAPLVLTKPGWKTSFKPERKIYIANDTVVVRDLGGIKQDLQLVKGQKVHSGGTFTKDDKVYVRTEKSVTNDWWYGVPVDTLDAGQDPDKYVGPLLDDDDDEIFKLPLDLGEEAKELYKNLSSREKLVAIVAKAQGAVLRVINFVNVFKKKTKK